MKKLARIVLCLGLMFCGVIFCACGKKADNLEEIGANLHNYYIDIEYDDANKSLYATQTVEYVNNSENAFSREHTQWIARKQ